VQPSNPKLDIQPTEKCIVWIREVNLIAQAKLDRSPWHQSRKSYKPCKACHTSSLRCYEGLYIQPLWKVRRYAEHLAIHKSSTCFPPCTGFSFHNQVTFQPKDWSLFLQKECTSEVVNKQVKKLESHTRALPDHILKYGKHGLW